MIKNIDKRNKVLVIVGPTSSGKTGLAVKLAHKFDGEIVSADSRQVYKHMDIGTGKDLDEYVVKTKNGSKNIPYHLIDVASPNTEFSLAKYLKLAHRAIKDIQLRGKLPIVVGGTGLYAQAIVDGYDLSSVKIDKELRKKLEAMATLQLFNRLKKLNPSFAGKLNQSDSQNKRRLIRYIEIHQNSQAFTFKKSKSLDIDFLIIGLNFPRDILRQRILKRIIIRLEKQNMVNEVKMLHEKYHVSWKRLISLGLEYRFISEYLLNKLSYEQMITKLHIATNQFAKRQMSWYRRWEKQGAKIYWVKDKKVAEKLVKKFIA